MGKAKLNIDVTAIAFLSYARQYHEAAEELFNRKPGLTRVLNALYFHVTESLLKAYLRAHGRPVEWSHDLHKLYTECLSLGLKVNSDDRTDLANVVSLLKAGNEDMAFRYFSPKSTFEPELKWTRRVVKDLMAVVVALVNSKQDPAKPRVATKFVVTASPSLKCNLCGIRLFGVEDSAPSGVQTL